jgi:hypothetical protein
MAGPSEKHSGGRESVSEYLIVVALLVLGAVGALAVFGPDVRGLFGAPAASAPIVEAAPPPPTTTPAPAPGKEPTP